MNVFWVAAAAFVLSGMLRGLYNDMAIRSREYTEPLKTMPENALKLMEEMLAEAAKDKSLSSEQMSQVETGIYRMLSEGAVEQRNFEMKQVREKISYLGLFLSWFMKQEGLTYAQVQAKYERDFSLSERAKHMKIIQSASGTNKNLLGKFYLTLCKKFGFAARLVQRLRGAQDGSGESGNKQAKL